MGFTFLGVVVFVPGCGVGATFPFLVAAGVRLLVVEGDFSFRTFPFWVVDLVVVVPLTSLSAVEGVLWMSLGRALVLRVEGRV